MFRKYWHFALIVVTFGADRLTKWLTLKYLRPVGAVTVIDGVLGFCYAQNTGAAFSMLSGSGWLLALLALAMGAAIVGYLIKRPDAPALNRAALALVAAGGLGNMVDRLAWGYVVDFVQLLFVRFAIFNVADISITFGAILMAIALVRPQRTVGEVK